MSRFVLLHGVLLWGGWMVIFMNLCHFFSKGRFDLGYFVISLVVMPSGGIIVGRSLWQRSEEAYFKFTQTPSKPPAGTA